MMLPDGENQFFEGERGARRMVRKVLPDGKVCFYQGERRAERLVRMVKPSGTTYFYDREGAEHAVRKQRPDGTVKERRQASAGCEWVRVLPRDIEEIMKKQQVTAAVASPIATSILPPLTWVY
jgi:hypothetical protein